jgi:thiamine-phosphate pyrophosphorylase
VTASSSPDPSPAANARLAEARLCLITGARPDLATFLAAAVRGGVDAVQVREKRLADGELLRVLTKARAITAELRIPLVVNDRPDLAVLAGADAVHMGQDDLPVEEARSFGLAVGQSTHAEREIDASTADYLGVGPVYATPTKAGRPPVGLGLVRYAAVSAPAPWFAIGGIDASNVADVVVAGARRIAVVRAIGDATDPEKAARTLRDALG